jgi:hypothetical protein
MSQFSEAAKGINAGITSVATKLHDLTKLAKGATLFNDNSSAISELTAVCKQDLLILNGEVEALERWVENGGSHDSSFGQSKSHSQQVVFNLKTQLGQQARSFAHLLTLRTKVCISISNLNRFASCDVYIFYVAEYERPKQSPQTVRIGLVAATS